MNRILSLTNTTAQLQTIPDLLNFEVPASGTVMLSDFFNIAEISNSDDLIAALANETFTVSDGENTFSVTDGIKYCTTTLNQVDLHSEYRDRSGKLRVHQTSRKLGTMVLWTGEGDDPTDPHSIGGGERLSFAYTAGQPEPLTKYIDFNMVDNETWLHEGYVTWELAKLDTLDLALVPRVTAVVSGTDYNIHDGYLIVPAVPGTGTVALASDITTADGGLVYMPLNDLGERAPSFWNATWDTATKKFINIEPAPAGNGEYNMFSAEINFAHFVRHMNLIGSGFIALNSSDTDQLGHGMRLKMVADVNTTDFGDHDWRVACTLCLHRVKSTTGMRV